MRNIFLLCTVILFGATAIARPDFSTIKEMTCVVGTFGDENDQFTVKLNYSNPDGPRQFEGSGILSPSANRDHSAGLFLSASMGINYNAKCVRDYCGTFIRLVLHSNTDRERSNRLYFIGLHSVDSKMEIATGKVADSKADELGTYPSLFDQQVSCIIKHQ